MQHDGNFVLYGAEMPLWASGTVGKGFRVIMQRDGNLVLYEQSSSSDKTKIPQWASDTQSRGDYLMCQDDGNMVVFSWNRNQVWSSNTTQSWFKFIFLLFVSNLSFWSTFLIDLLLLLLLGNILYRGARLNKNEMLKSSNGRFRAVMEPSGSFVLYVGRSVLWTTNTTGTGFQLVMHEPTGNLIVYDVEEDQVWSSNSSQMKADYLVCQNDGNLVLFNTKGKSVWSTNLILSGFFLV